MSKITVTVKSDNNLFDVKVENTSNGKISVTEHRNCGELWLRGFLTECRENVGRRIFQITDNGRAQFQTAY